MSKVGKSLTSTIHNDRGYSFGGAMDRFRAPTQKQQSPPPNKYSISDSIGYDQGPFKTTKSIKPHFSKDRRVGIDLLFKMNVDRDPSPGPGTYTHFSEFNNTRKHNASIRKSSRRKSDEY